MDRQLVFLKACPKCSGDLVLDGDMWGKHFRCLQCGLMKDVDKVSGQGSNVILSEELEAA